MLLDDTVVLTDGKRRARTTTNELLLLANEQNDRGMLSMNYASFVWVEIIVDTAVRSTKNAGGGGVLLTLTKG